jgi:hypothetical protein
MWWLIVGRDRSNPLVRSHTHTSPPGCEATRDISRSRTGSPSTLSSGAASSACSADSALSDSGAQRGLNPSAALAKRSPGSSAIPSRWLTSPNLIPCAVQLARKQDGTAAATTVEARKRAVLFSLLNYAVDKKHFPMNPLASVSWKSPKVAEAIDRRRVVDQHQAQALLDAVAAQGPMGQHLEAFFGCLYHAALRPAETVMLTRDELELPDDQAKWGWLHLGASAPSTGGAWNETGDRRERRRLKHHAASESAELRSPPPSANCSASTPPGTAPLPMGACSAAKAAVCSPTPSTAASGKKPVRPPSHPPRKHRPWLNAPTISATPACPPGSTQPSPPASRAS